MGLRFKFNLVLGFFMVFGALGTGFVADELLQSHAREEVKQFADVMMESAMAVRAYTVEEIKPLLEVQQEMLFLPQSVPAYAANQYVSKFQQGYPLYSYREAALNPTNPKNSAVAWEAEIIEWFRSNQNQEVITGERESSGRRMLYFGRPIKITKANCLACHGVASEAPETFLKVYGSENGFGWKLDEIVGVQLVTVPMDLSLERANEEFHLFMSSIIIMFALIFIVLNVLLHFLVIKKPG